MKNIATINNKIDEIIENYNKMQLENKHLKEKLENLKNENDVLVRNNQDMSLKIEKVLTIKNLKANDYE